MNHSCIVDPKNCPDGLSMEVWVKLQKSDFNSEEYQVLVASGKVSIYLLLKYPFIYCYFVKVIH